MRQVFQRSSISMTLPPSVPLLPLLRRDMKLRFALCICAPPVEIMLFPARPLIKSRKKPAFCTNFSLRCNRVSKWRYSYEKGIENWRKSEHFLLCCNPTRRPYYYLEICVRIWSEGPCNFCTVQFTREMIK